MKPISTVQQLYWLVTREEKPKLVWTFSFAEVTSVLIFISNKKFELMLTRRAKAYSSSGSVV